jgi:hypothetical protein
MRSEEEDLAPCLFSLQHHGKQLPLSRIFNRNKVKPGGSADCISVKRHTVIPLRKRLLKQGHALAAGQIYRDAHRFRSITGSLRHGEIDNDFRP